VAIWIYTLVFAFASLWFAHYLLQALQKLRASVVVDVVDPAPSAPPAVPPAAEPLPLPPGPSTP
jgi:hypothetical protein